MGTRPETLKVFIVGVLLKILLGGWIISFFFIFKALVLWRFFLDENSFRIVRGIGNYTRKRKKHKS